MEAYLRNATSSKSRSLRSISLHTRFEVIPCLFCAHSFSRELIASSSFSGLKSRFVSAFIIEFATLVLLYGSLSHDDFVTINDINSKRSNVVKRAPHFSHSRRRRIAFPSSVARESITFVSRFLHFGHFIKQIE